MWYGVVRRLTSEAFTHAVASLGRRDICISIQSPWRCITSPTTGSPSHVGLFMTSSGSACPGSL